MGWWVTNKQTNMKIKTSANGSVEGMIQPKDLHADLEGFAKKKKKMAKMKIPERVAAVKG